MATSSQVLRPSLNTAIPDAAQAVMPGAPFSGPGSWPVVAGLSLPEVMDAVGVLQQSLAAGPVSCPRCPGRR